MKQKITSLLISLILSVSAASVFAAEVGVVDLNKISKESKAVADVQKKIGQKQDDFQKDVDKKKKSVEEEVKKFQEKSAKMKKPEVEKTQKELQKKLDDLKQYADKKQATLKTALNDGLTKVNEEMQKIVASIAKKKGLKVVVSSAQVVFSEESADITEEVIEQLNDQITKVDVKF